MNKIIIKTSLLTIFAAGVAYSATSMPAYDSPGVQRAKEIQDARKARMQANRESQLRMQNQLSALTTTNIQQSESITKMEEDHQQQINILKAAKAETEKQFTEEKQQHDALKMTHAQTEKDLSAEKVKVLQGTIRDQLEKQIAKAAEEALLWRHTVVSKAAPQDGEESIFSTIDTTFEQHKGYCTKRIGEAEIGDILSDVTDSTDPSKYITSKQTEIAQIAAEYAKRRVNDYDTQLKEELAELIEVQASTVEEILQEYAKSLASGDKKSEVKEEAKKEEEKKAEEDLPGGNALTAEKVDQNLA